MSPAPTATPAPARERWRSSLGFTLAAAGSAVGLGNLWKFPYVTWLHGGPGGAGSFLLVYLACIVGVGFPLMAAEILIGRAAQRGSVDAYAHFGGPPWRWAGWLGVVTSVMVFAFYSVVAGWSLWSFVRCLRWSFRGYEAPAPGDFGAFMAHGALQVGLGALFIALTGAVVLRGVRAGIDRMARVLMPALFGILLFMVVVALRLPGAGEAIRHLTRIELASIDRHALLAALGHAFFTLSVGIGAMITYGSYLGPRTRILPTAALITGLDTLAALLACGVIFPVIFSVPELRATLEQEGEVSSMGMLFVTLPDLFYRHVPGGRVVAPLFYLLVAFAALSSTVPPLELVVTTLVERRPGRSRAAATAMAAATVALLMVGCALSLGASAQLSTWRPFGPLRWPGATLLADKTGVLAVFDHVTANWMLPLGGLCVALVAGWLVPEATLGEELGLDPRGRLRPAARAWRWACRYLCPAAIAWIVWTVIRGGDFS